jgi:hypothetical protein
MDATGAIGRQRRALIGRRQLLVGGAASALFLARPWAADAKRGGAPSATASRQSRLFPGTFLVHSDLHNHTMLSDGSGRIDDFYGQMRAAGLDVAALTEHAIQGKDDGHLTCYSGPCSYAVGIHEGKWHEMGHHADESDDPGAFTAIRGFEWTTGHLGHINVWLTENWTDPEQTGSLMSPRGLTGHLAEYVEPVRQVHDATGAVPDPFTSIDGFYEWLRTPVEEGGGLDGLAGFNHPRPDDFNHYELFPEAIDRLVSCEIFTGTTDFLFVGRDDGRPSPINSCLDAGWRVGLIGVSDEHGTQFGLAGKGRGGLWVSDLSRAGVREAMLGRRAFATRLAGLHLDAAATPHLRRRAFQETSRMGGTLRHTRGPVTFELDIDRGTDWVGKELTVQILRSGDAEPTLQESLTVRVPAPDQPVISFTTDIDIDDGPWVLLRVGDPAVPIESRAPEAWKQSGYGAAAAYPSPFYLSPT